MNDSRIAIRDVADDDGIVIYKSNYFQNTKFPVIFLTHLVYQETDCFSALFRFNGYGNREKLDFHLYCIVDYKQSCCRIVSRVTATNESQTLCFNFICLHAHTFTPPFLSRNIEPVQVDANLYLFHLLNEFMAVTHLTRDLFLVRCCP